MTRPQRVLLVRARKAAGFTQEELAHGIGVDRSTIGRWESGETEPLPWLQPKLAELLGVTRARLSELLAPAEGRGTRRRESLKLGLAVAVTPDVLGRVLSDTATDAMEFTQLTASSAVGQGTLEHLEVVVSDLNRAYDTAYLEAAQQHIGHISARHEGNDSSHPLAVSSPTTPPPPSSNTVMSPWGVVSEINPSSVEPIDEAFITSIHARIFELLALDAQVGGNETSGQALRLFRAVHRRIGVSPCPKRLRRDLYATVGELAEVAGWLFYDADQQDSMRRMNQEALYYLRWAGCRSLELLTLQNMSMQAEYLNRPSEAFTIVQSVLEADRLSPRMESLFLARGAHALAQQQQQADAVRTFQKARAFYLDGPRDDDPVWATWVDDRQFSWFEAMVQAELGECDKSVHIFAEALATSPKNRVRGLYSRSVYLFESLVSVGDWREAEQLIPKLAPYISEVGSGRTASILRKTLHTVHATTTIPTLKDGAEWLRGVLLEGYKGADCRGCYSRRAGQGVV